MSLVTTSASWLRQSFGWSNSWISWRERLIGLAFVLAAGALVYFGANFLAYWQSAILWLGFGVALATASRQGWIKLFGPVLFYDMVRMARRSRYSIIRIAYAGLLLLILCYSYLILMLTVRQGVERREMAVFAETFFLTFILLQLALVILLTPAYVAGAISEEKDRKTLEFLLATDLNNREIVLSKLLSRLANITLLLLTGLPILSILQFVGGVDPDLVIAGFAGVGLTMLGIAGVSILLSTLFKKPRDSISLCYLLMIAYAGLATVTLTMSSMPLMKEPILFGIAGPTLNDLSEILNYGNPLIAVYKIMQGIGGRMMGGRGNLASVLPAVLERYAWFHLSLTLICVVWSIWRVRAIALKQSAGGTVAKLRWWQRLRPSVGSNPMLWKEFYIERGPKTNWLAGLALGVLILLTVGIGFWIVGDYLNDMLFLGRDRIRLAENMNVWFRVAGTGVACLSLLMLGVRASSTITSERERDTFDALVTSRLTAEEMLLGKFYGNIAGMRLVWLWLGSMMVLAVLSGGLHPLAVLLFVSAWFVYAVFVTMVGMGYSMVCKSSIWSSLFTVLTTLFLGGGHWLITGCCIMPLFGAVFALLGRPMGQHPALEMGEHLIRFEAGMTPPVVFGLGSFSWRDWERTLVQEKEAIEILIFSLISIPLWLLASGLLWFGLLLPTFRKLARRVEFSPK